MTFLDANIVMKTLSATHIPLYHWKFEIISFLHVLLERGVTLTRFLIKRKKDGAMRLSVLFDQMISKSDKEIVALWTCIVHLGATV